MKKGNIFIKRPAMAISVSIIMLLAGIISLFNLPVEQYPDIAPPTVYVSTSYTGADADAVMQSVVMPLEEAINGVENMIYMSSSAGNDGSAWIQVYFKQGTDPDIAAVNVQNRVAKAQDLLPAEVTREGVSTEKRQNGYLKIGGLTCINGKYDENFIANYLEISVFPRLKRIEGVGDVQAYSSTYAMRVWLKPDLMAQYGLEPNDVNDAINRQSFVAAVGSLGEQSKNAFQYTIKYKGRYTDVKQFENIVIKSDKDGNVLHLKDVAKVELGATAYNFKGTIDGKPGVNFTVYPVAGVNMTQVNNTINKVLDEMQAELPAGLKFQTFMDTNDFLFESIHEVVETLIIAILLVILVVYFFLQDFKSTFIPSISIIVSLVGTFACLLIAGFSINILTLFALVLAIGTVVDDAIVVVEAVQSKFDAGYQSPYLATRDAMSDVTMAVISCTLVFMAVFIPVTFMGGTAGVFYTQFGVTMATAVGLSMVSALTLCPALCALLMRPASGTKSARSFNGRVKMAYNATYSALLGKYKRGVMWIFRSRWVAWAGMVAGIALFVYLVSTTRTGLVPQEDKGFVQMMVSSSPGTSMDDMEKIMSRVENVVKAQPEVASYGSIVGFGGGTGSCYGMVFVTLKNWGDRKGDEHSVDAVLQRLQEQTASIKEATVFCMEDAMIPGYGEGNAIDLNLQDRTGGDNKVFYENTQKFLMALNERPEIEMAYSSYSINFPQYQVDVDATKCERVGLSSQGVLDVLGAYTGGSYVSNFNKFGKVYRVMTQASPEYRMDEYALNRIFIRTDDGMAPISQFASLKKTVGAEGANRFNLYSSISASVDVVDGYSTGEAQKAIAEVAKQTLPHGYSYEYGGIAREEAEQGGGSSTVVVYGLCIMLIYLILVCLYESFLVPLAVILSVPFGLMGSFFFARLFGLENNIYLQTGVIMLIGLLAKTAILITEFASERRRKGMGIVESAYSAAVARFRPILMTVMTMVIGMLPLVFASGAGANGNRALGTGVVGGLLFGTLALVFVVPVFFIVFQYLQEKYVRGPKHVEADAQTVAEHGRFLMDKEYESCENNEK